MKVSGNEPVYNGNEKEGSGYDFLHIRVAWSSILPRCTP